MQAIEAELGAKPAAASRHLGLISATARQNLAEARVIVAGSTPTAAQSRCSQQHRRTGRRVAMST
jgi:hypothetical protein